jgi:hypothetical protein
MHQDTPKLHFPFSQAFEQHSSSPPQSLPATLHEGLSAAHVPSVQTPPQHAASPSHAPPSDTHAASAH